MSKRRLHAREIVCSRALPRTGTEPGTRAGGSLLRTNGAVEGRTSTGRMKHMRHEINSKNALSQYESYSKNTVASPRNRKNPSESVAKVSSTDEPMAGSLPKRSRSSGISTPSAAPISMLPTMAAIITPATA